MLKAVVFDLDDTLYPERDFVLSGFRAVARWAEEGLGIQYNNGFLLLISLFEHGVRGDTFNQWLKRYDLPDNNYIPQMIDIYRQHIPQIKPFPEAINLLSQLNKEYKLGLITDGYLQVQKNKLDALALADFFDAIVFSDEWGRDYWKPHERPFVNVLEELGEQPEASVFIADNPAKDFYGARKVGMKSIRFRYPEGEYNTLEPISKKYAPDYEITQLKELLPLVKRISKF